MTETEREAFDCMALGLYQLEEDLMRAAEMLEHFLRHPSYPGEPDCSYPQSGGCPCIACKARKFIENHQQSSDTPF